MKNISLLFYALFLFACSHSRTKLQVPETPAVFPAGVYQHDIEVRADTPQGPKDFAFSGIVQKSAEKIVVTGLAYGLTAFKITDDLHGRIDKDITMESFKKLGPHFDRIYQPLKIVMLMESPNQNSKVSDIKLFRDGQYQSFKVQSDHGPVEIEFLTADENKIPKDIKMTSPKYSISIKMTEYSLKDL